MARSVAHGKNLQSSGSRGTEVTRQFNEERLMATQGLVYDPCIRDALTRRDVTLDELKALRTEAIDLIKRQGNLAGALIELEEEIKRRGG
jgi:hypothetical protein